MRSGCFAAILLIGYGGVARAQQHEVGRLIPFSSVGASTAVTKPTLALRGGSLILSDSPEQIKSAGHLPAAMYRDKVTGDFRVFYHHQNESSRSLSVGLAITNTSTRPEIILARGAGDGLDVAPDLAGQVAAYKFIASSPGFTFVTVLLPGKSYLQVQNLPKLNTASGIFEYVLVTAQGDANSLPLRAELLHHLSATSLSAKGEQPDLPDGFNLGTATVSTLAFTGEPPADPASIPVLHGDTHIRGTFAHFDRSGSFTISQFANPQSITVDTAAPGKQFSDPMPNEYELGADAVDGGTPVYNDGNYGVIYTFHVAFQSATLSQNISLLLQPSGGSGHFVAFTNGQPASSPYVTYKSAWYFSDITLSEKRTVIDLQTTLPGGAAGPQVFLFNPESVRQ